MKKLVIPCIIALCSTACTTTNMLTEQEITSRYESVAEFQQAFNMAETSNLKILSPTHYEQAKAKLEQAMASAKRGKESSEKIAQEGMEILAQAKKTGDKSADMLDTVLEARLKAEKAGAPTLLKDEFKGADEDLADLAKAVEDNRLEKVREDRVVLAKTYRQLELKAMKQDIIESAQTAIKDATDMGAKKYAPKTFSQAEEEMRLALNILEVNRGASQEAENYAERARWWAERSMAVTETVKSFKQGDYTDEDIVLWYQEQISSAVAPVNKSLPLNYDHKRLMTSIRTDLEGVVSDNSQLASQNKMLSAESQTLANAGRQQAIEMQNKLNMTRQQAQEADKKFEFVQGLFDEKEAVVFRQQNAVLLRTQGFDFPSGKSEITSGNFALLQKIIKAIDEYPTAKVAVSGHTDSVGDAQFNQKLSEDRAQKVAEFLIKVGNIDEDRISYKGYGEARPIASNDTQDGRSENRRVEITIVN
ncbi:MAG: hypothetical protein CMD81_04480 [Gammaproteobacteria bacterium]|nr:hypothetical protein [Gammaproteobacteria bacterium]HBF09174.1 hypothetical protein [Gammaproteobacteria bacterium]|tara:strand:+ start:7586 stop:9016 length:1431 start_codon:yes stop_codon:yes gene_type:complete